MTAKEALREIVEGMSEEEAEEIYPLLDGRFWNEESPERAERLSNSELLKLPRALRSFILRREMAQHASQNDEMLADAESWRFSDADALKHIDD